MSGGRFQLQSAGVGHSYEAGGRVGLHFLEQRAAILWQARGQFPNSNTGYRDLRLDQVFLDAQVRDDEVLPFGRVLAHEEGE